MGDAEYISTPPLSCKPIDELGSNAVEQEVAKELENWASKCLSKNVCNLLFRRNFEQAQHLSFVQFANKMLLEFEVFVSPTCELVTMERHAALSSYTIAGGNLFLGNKNCTRDAIHLMCFPASVAAQYSASAVESATQE